MAKLAAGTDPEADDYTLFVADAGPGRDACECRRFLRWSHCSHVDGVRTVLANGWWAAAEREFADRHAPAEQRPAGRHPAESDY